jgi:signal recognition particle subunit SRP19
MMKMAWRRPLNGTSCDARLNEKEKDNTELSVRQVALAPMVRVTEHVEEATRVHNKALVLYPAFWDAKRTVAAGRKVALSLAVEYPTVQDVAECCAYLGLPPEVQQKAYCRDVLTQPVRLRVSLHNESGILVNPQVATRASPASPFYYSLAPCDGSARRPSGAPAARQPFV